MRDILFLLASLSTTSQRCLSRCVRSWTLRAGSGVAVARKLSNGLSVWRARIKAVVWYLVCRIKQSALSCASCVMTSWYCVLRCWNLFAGGVRPSRLAVRRDDALDPPFIHVINFLQGLKASVKACLLALELCRQHSTSGAPNSNIGAMY